LGGFDAEILMYPWQFLNPGIIKYKIIHDLQQAGFAAHPGQILIHHIGGGIIKVFFPLKKIFFWSFDGSVPQPFAIIAGKNKLYGTKKRFDKLRALIGNTLTNTFPNVFSAVLYLQYS